MSAIKHDVPFRMVIEYRPGDGPKGGFSLSIESQGEYREKPEPLATLRAAFKRGERVLKDAGFATIMPSWVQGEVEL